MCVFNGFSGGGPRIRRSRWLRNWVETDLDLAADGLGVFFERCYRGRVFAGGFQARYCALGCSHGLRDLLLCETGS